MVGPTRKLPVQPYLGRRHKTRQHKLENDIPAMQRSIGGNHVGRRRRVSRGIFDFICVN
jgi:hypothetical protein